MAKLSQRQIVAKIAPGGIGVVEEPEFVDYWSSVTGGEITAAVEKVYDGGQKFPDTLCASAEVGDITVTRNYDPVKDGSSIATVRHLVGQAYYNVNIFELNCDLVVPDSSIARVYTNALLVGLTEPDGDASSGAPATFSMTFSIGKLA
tara:strand:- start:301 stop:744 length:444 start_codon:yes stop_codon:yes gene_type:complete